jgi:arsenite-transporting ATPase
MEHAVLQKRDAADRFGMELLALNIQEAYMLYVIDHPTRYLFFTGKGGVGKTSLASATAVALADRGKQVLLVSTDPASNLAQVLETSVQDGIASVEAVPGLSTVNIDPEAAAARYRDRIVGPTRGVLPEAVVRSMEEQLSGACTTEIAAFDQFTRLLSDPENDGRFDHIVFDTAPTGHTLRLLQLPAAWSNFIEENPSGSSCLGPLSGLDAQRAQYAAVVRALHDGERTTMVLVSRPDRSALKEAARASAELQGLGIGNQRIVINGVFHAHDHSDPLAIALEQRAAQALADVPAPLQRLPSEEIPLAGHNLVGIAALRALVADEPVFPAGDADLIPEVDLPTLGELIDDIERDNKGLVMVMGKGGVGKTTIAAAIAIELAARGHDVHLSTTDPAAHLGAALQQQVDRLTVSRIEPKEETHRYIEHVMATRGKDLDANGRRLLEEDLRSPCTEEVAVFHAFSRVVREGARKFVVLDTAPTGHTLLLLDQTGAYHREVVRSMKLPQERMTTPMMRLQDPVYTKILIATLPETTPVVEAAQLQADLRRAGIEPYAWIINQSLAAARPIDSMLRARAHAELPRIVEVRDHHAVSTYLIPMMADEPVGPKRLAELVHGNVVARSGVE